jgi:hypothetical protein
MSIIYELVKSLDSRFHGNDKKLLFRIYYEFVIINSSILLISLSLCKSVAYIYSLHCISTTRRAE